MLSTKDPLQTQGNIQTESEEMEKDIPCQQKSKAQVAIFISDKIDFKIKIVTGDKEEHYIMIKESIQEEGKITVNVYAPNIGAPKYLRYNFNQEVL